ncbi:autotransporter outer membrane beta-barrel domain-containing protein [Rhizobium sp. TRM96647]|uniref:autotransporter outer membrane beta-barrel domain-containing protein n=1 Tax=unclassified Rhizobium TaxID=2613769 RepID=UPI0021E8C7EC|nr:MULTISPECIES: autotransporter outer membrane beta-barrel domain-containing protein [unclassified Rhizobium]MCV3735047.1 autotransporter outer membrane beta-barrel domain-containing protein [Rhizobium sp. TRM96647]MCV3757417.1 autotransporter outer membrane beta-barrel domain-containing protein [Rhizobium sp. TRM96650]
MKHSSVGLGQEAFVPNRNVPHALIVLAVGLGGATVAGDAYASCNGSATQTLDAASYGYSWSLCQGDDGVDKSDEKNGAQGDNINFNAINAGTYTGGTTLPYGSEGVDQNALMIGRTRGGNGVDEGAAGAGGTVTITNGGDMTLTSSGDPGSIGNLISGLSFGGDGDSDNDNYKSNGGHGGAGNTVTITNSGVLTVESMNANTARGMTGILGWSQGGVGGEQNSGAAGDQVGGNGGNGGAVNITNTGQIFLGGVAVPLNGLDNAWGIAAKSIGGAGGNDNGAGGAGGFVTVTNGSTSGGASIGAISIYANDTDSVRGIYALTQGSHGTASFDSSDNGGNGAAGGGMSLSTHGDITVISSGAVSGVSGGLVGIGQGGDGGTGYSSSDGGAGGSGSADVLTLTAEGGATVSTQGDDIAGMVGLSQGGRGGDGDSGEKDSSGGNGGTGGQIQMNNYGAIKTDGSHSYGLLGQSIGGQGGNGGDDTAVLGTSGGGGYGGNAGGVGVYMTGDASITTTGDFSAAVTLHSIGGGGGTGGDFTDVLGGGAGNGGNGGNGEVATVNNAGGTITTYGEHSYGILVQSIGGSGGTGGIADGLTLELGGDGGSGGSSGTASVQNAGKITTSGYSAHGIVAQSITGGGGAAGTAGGVLSIGGSGGSGNTAGNAEVQNSGVISTAGDAAIGIISQSIGGGGGTGGGAAGIATVGGQGGAGGNGAHADVLLNGGSITTRGEMAHGIMAQSIGGGGGNGGNVIDMSVGVPALGVGGTASGGGSGGWTCVTNLDASDGCSAGTGTPQAVSIATGGSGALGILAQSIGGGGGNGGNATGDDAGLGSFQIGGGGGGGGYANTVTVGFDGLTLTTQGSHAAGIVAQSIGGGGGTGGSASSYSEDIGFTASVAVGGTGGSGGAGGAVIVDLIDSTIYTGQGGGDVTDAIGVLAQSISGGGGSGGSSIADALTVAVPTGEDVSLAMSVSTAVGGSGGSSHDANSVSLTLDGTAVSTKGVSSHGLVAQSIGGGGGNGGSASSMSATAGTVDTVSADIGVSIGGSGSGGGNGSTVNVDLRNGASVTTADDYANAIVAQSIGGGGGNGGVGSVNSNQIGSGFNLTANVGLGGSGSGGASGGNATVDLESGTLLQTSGSGSRGVVAQSIGGGGGTSQGASVGLSASADLPGGEAEESEGSSAFTASVGVSLGRTGGSGGTAGTATVTSRGRIITSGADADGVLAQSIGGGGGLGGSVGQASSDDSEPLDDEGESDCSSEDGDGESGYCFDVSVGATIDDGGTGGAAANGNTVTLTHGGQITTTGDWADGIVAQSIGGGGGAGGTSTASGSQATANITVGVGGSGGAGGNGGAIDVTFDSDNGAAGINTSGYSAYGVLLQSIGGGGGQGGDGSDKAAGKITIGGGFGGSGGGGGNGGNVAVAAGSWLGLQTSGDDSIGLLAQSIGGGGGVGGAGSSEAAEDDDSHAIDLVVGGAGGSGGSGGEVDLNYGGSVDTHGDRAHGIVAQSIGGGGGIGGAGEADSIGSLVVGGSGGGTVNGNTVTVNLTDDSSIHTRGGAAHGIVAQSIGGGGGIGGTASGAPLSFKGNSPGNYGDGDDVSVTVNGGIITDGDHSFGVLAQSIGGGGGFGGNATSAFIGSNGNLSSEGKSGDVTVTLDAGRNIQATGEGSIGIFAQSDAGTDNNGTVNVTVNGSVTGGSGDSGAGIWVSAGKNNEVTVNAGGSVSAASGVAVQYTEGVNAPSGSALTVYNTGVINGSVKGAATPDAKLAKTARIDRYMAVSVVNRAGGLLTDAEVYEADVVNHGRLAVGGSGAIDAARITGDLAQGRDGVLAINADFAGFRMDRLVVDGDAALAGGFTVSAESVLPGISLPFLSAGGSLDHSLVGQSAIFDYAMTQTGNRLSLSADGAHFADPGFALSKDQDNVADHLQEIWDAGGGPYGTLFGTLGTLADGDSGGYGAALSDMSPGVAGAAAAGSIVTTQQHLDLLLSCPMFAGDSAFLTETECVWSQAGVQRLDQESSGGVSGFGTTTYSMQAGTQVEVSPNWFVGFAGGYDRSVIRGDDGRVNADGDILYAGASLKHETGPWLLSGAVAGSYGWYDNTRTIRIPGFSGQAEGDPEIYNVSARLRAAYTFSQDAYYVRPLVDFDLIYSHAGGYRESGAGMLDLLVDDTGQWSFHVTPAIEVGTRVDLNETTVMRAFAATGVSFSSADSWETSARLAGAPSGVGVFDSEVPLAEVVGRLTAGVDVANDNGFSLRLNYQGSFSDTYTSHGGAVRVGYKF